MYEPTLRETMSEHAERLATSTGSQNECRKTEDVGGNCESDGGNCESDCGSFRVRLNVNESNTRRSSSMPVFSIDNRNNNRNSKSSNNDKNSEEWTQVRRRNKRHSNPPPSQQQGGPESDSIAIAETERVRAYSDSDSEGSDGLDEDDSGFVKIEGWKSPTEPDMVSFRPTITHTTDSSKYCVADAQNKTSLMGLSNAESKSISDGSWSADETKIRLIEAMEDMQVSESARETRSLRPQQSPVKLNWVGLGDTAMGPRPSYAEALKQRFADATHINSSSATMARSGIVHNDCLDGATECGTEDSEAGAECESVSDSSSESGSDAEPNTHKSSEDSIGSNIMRGSEVSVEHTLANEGLASERSGTVEFVAPGVTKQTAMSLLRRVLDIEVPVIQQKMVEFLLIDGVIASLIGFITHYQGSIYSPTHVGGSTSSAAGEVPASVLQEFEVRAQRRQRLQRQRKRTSGLTEDEVRRGYNAAHMLASNDQHARRVVEAKLGVIVPSLMAVFHRDALGSFHHACMLLEHCLSVAPLKTARLLLFTQGTVTRWWAGSESVAKGHAPICDVLPYMSEYCVQMLFLKAEFVIWSGRMMASLGLAPNDALVVSDALGRIGLGSVAGALATPGDAKTHSPQQAKALQLVRNRFVQLNRGGFLGQMIELVEDADMRVSESAAEFLTFLINDCSAFCGFNVLFRAMYESEVPVRRLAQLIVNSPTQALTHQAVGATRVLHALLAKTTCVYGLRVREAQGIRDPEIGPRGSQLLVQVGKAARSALESFLPGLLATVVGLQATTDLTSHVAYNRRLSAESLRLPEYDEADPDIDTDDTEAESSDSSSSSNSSCDDLGFAEAAVRHIESIDGAGSSRTKPENHSMSDDDMYLRASTLFRNAYAESLDSGSISSSLSPSSTLSASPRAGESTTPERNGEVPYCGLDTEDLGLLMSLPKPSIDRLDLLRVCVEVLREADDVDEAVGWVDLRVWKALTTWFLNHPHNSVLHHAVYQLISMLALEGVRARRALRRIEIHPRAVDVPGTRRSRAKPRGLSDSECGDEQQARRARRRRAVAERVRRAEMTNCDSVLTYLVEHNQWVDKLVRRIASPNFDGARGYAELVLNTLRLAVQADRRRYGKSVKVQMDPEEADEWNDGKGSVQHSGDALDDSLLPDLAYHDPPTRRRLCEHPLYRLQKWQIALLYSPAFKTHLAKLRAHALEMAREPEEFMLCDTAKAPIEDVHRPTPHFSPLRVRVPAALDGAAIRRKRLQISMGLLLGANAQKPPPEHVTSSVVDDMEGDEVDEYGIDLDSLFARMLGFTQDLVVPYASPAKHNAAYGKAVVSAEEKPKDARGAKKQGVRAMRRKRAKPAGMSAVASLLDDISGDATDVLCSALTDAKAHQPKPRKKPVVGVARRRRARLHRRASNPGLAVDSESSVQGSSNPAA